MIIEQTGRVPVPVFFFFLDYFSPSQKYLPNYHMFIEFLVLYKNKGRSSTTQTLCHLKRLLPVPDCAAASSEKDAEGVVK